MRAPSLRVIVAALVAAVLLTLGASLEARRASAFVQAFSNHLVVSATPTVALTGVTAGNTLVFCVYMQSNNRTLDSMSGGSNSYSETVARTVNGGSNHALTMWRAFNVSGGDYTVTLTMSASSTYSIGVVELSGVTTTDPLDSAPAGETAEPGQTLDVGPTATLAQADEILVGCGGGSVSSRPFNAMSGWTNRVDLTNPYLAMWTKTVSATTAQSLPLDTTANNQFIIGNLATFKDAGGGSTATCTRALLGVGPCD